MGVDEGANDAYGHDTAVAVGVHEIVEVDCGGVVSDT